MDQPYSDSLSIPWSLAKKALFRVIFLFFLFFILFIPNEILPLSNPFYDFYSHPLQLFVPWMGNHLLHIPYKILPSYGNGDTTYDYLVLLVITVATLLGCLIWTLTDKRRNNHKVLYYWLTVLLRYYCAFTLLSFGIVKLYKLQFPFPSPGSLIQPFGTYSPMHAAWAFFGYSRAYNYFMGSVEVATGLFLLFRRTTRLGAGLLLMVMANVTVINYCFDVVEKIISSALLLMSIFLLLQERQRLIDFFLRNSPVAPGSEWKPRLTKKWVRISLIAFKYLLITAIVININWAGIKLQNYSDDRAKPFFHGIFNVQTFVKNKDTLPPLMTDTIRWRRLIINDLVTTAYASVRTMNDSAKSYIFKADTIAKKVAMYRPADSTKKFWFTYSFIGKDLLYMQGKWKDDSVSVILKKYDLNNFILVNRGFHFVNDIPYQR